MRYTAFPPGTENLLLPLRDRTSARIGIESYPACKRRSSVVAAVARQLVTIAGAWAVPGRRLHWAPPPDVQAELESFIRRSFPGGRVGPIILRRPAHRPGFTVGVVDGSVIAGVCKIRPAADAGVSREIAALDLVARARPEEFRVPTVIDVAVSDGWTMLALSSPARGPHGVVHSSRVPAIAEDVSRCLAGLESGETHHPEWVPVHGDFTPWNLRSFGDGPVLFDWENSGYGPVGSDLAWYDINAEAIGLPGGGTGVSHGKEAYRHLLGMALAKPDHDAPSPTVLRLLHQRSG